MPKVNKDNLTVLSQNLFPVVGIGASAGGMDAFKKFIKAIPEHSSMAYVLVQHLHPEHSSILPEILQKETNIPVHTIKNNLQVEPDAIYIIPSNKILIAFDGILQLKPRPSAPKENMPIDIFFTSLAEVHQAASIGIILSGTGTDGITGLKNIKDSGGITFAQKPSGASYSAMPQNAISAEVIDFVMEPEAMPLELVKLHRTFNILSPDVHINSAEEEVFRSILAVMRVRYAMDFTYYKQTTTRRRIIRRMAILKMEKVKDYLTYLQQNKPEQDLLFNDLLIPVTNFFRDTKTFDNLCELVFPELIKNKSGKTNLRIWVAGCSTGQEAYSIAICLHEYLTSSGAAVNVQIFATDVSEKSIAKARSGKYSKKEAEEISESRLQQFFTRVDGVYQITKIIRDMCVFAVHNFLKEPPFANIDFISCRNVMIYMEPLLQKRAFNTFHYALRGKGLLLLGKSETATTFPELYFQSDKKEKLYAKKLTSGRYMHVTTGNNETTMKNADNSMRSAEGSKDDFQKNADAVLLSKYTPAGVVVNEQFDIVQFRGQTGLFLEPSPGKPSLNILKMAREGLSFELRNALQKARNTNETFIKKGIPINKGKNLITIEVIPLLNTAELHFLILFRDTTLLQEVPGKPGSSPVPGNLQNGKRIKELEKELLQAREDMRSITEEQGAANEELQSANEELLSTSEELQSLNEELETSQEELQSTNEELITVNQELFDRNEQLNIARVYSETIVNTVHEPLLVLDNDFKIKSANRSFYETFRITEKETIGKVLFSLQNEGWNIPSLKSNLLSLYEDNEKMMDWEVSHLFPVAGLRFIHFNAQPVQKENNQHWLLLALSDITARKEIEIINKRYSDNLKRILEGIPQITSIADNKGRVSYFNRNFLEYSGLSFDEALAGSWQAVVQPEMRETFNTLWRHCIESEENFRMEVLLKRNSDKMYRWHLAKTSPIYDQEGKITSWIGVAIDVHEEKSKSDLRSEFIGIASHELRTPLTAAKAFIQLLELNLADTNKDNVVLVKKAAASIEKLQEIISELLDVSKIQNGKLSLYLSDFNPAEMLTEAIESIQLTTTQKLVLTGKTDHNVNGDKERLKQVVTNLLTNAIKYSPGKEQVQVHMVQKDNEIIVSVRDWGIGIEKANLNKIFTMYYREDNRAYYSQGLGIGLSISAEIIARHNGKIWVESEPGKGSTFYFSIPQ